ncbi:hypothetical protein [Streptomyces tauricus]|uniref:hypothetical protein n=1 Tax=Streptomyces tauricus TaxID=68274 RepID=UPI00341EB335
MPDNTAAGPSRDQRDERDERGNVTRTPGTGGAGHGGGSAAGRLTGSAGAAGTAGPEASARTGSATRDDVLGGRDTASQERVRDGGQDTMVGGRIPATGPRTPEQDRSPAREGAAKVPGSALPGSTGKAAPGGRSGASREGVLGAEARVNAGAGTGTGVGSGGRLMPHDEGDKWSLRLQHAVAGFVDGPRGSVEEADQVLQEVAERFTDAVNQRRRALSTAWQGSADDKADTEQLRLALKDYRELTERLLKI